MAGRHVRVARGLSFNFKFRLLQLQPRPASALLSRRQYRSLSVTTQRVPLLRRGALFHSGPVYLHSNSAVRPQDRDYSEEEPRTPADVAPLEPHSGVSRSSSSREAAEGENKGPEHAVVSTFDLFSIGIGPSSSHTGACLCV
jgi:hypothetical protein